MQIHILSPEGEVIGPISIHSPQAMAAHPDTLSRGDSEDDTWLPISQRRTSPPPVPAPAAVRPATPSAPAPIWRQVLGANIMTAALLSIPSLLVFQGAPGLPIALLIAAIVFFIGYATATA